MEKISIWNKYRDVPPEAQKKITGGRLNGMTDISPVWRMYCLTREFGPAGVGWRFDVTKETIFRETAEGSGEVIIIVEGELRYKTNDGWSEAVHGVGGSKLVAKERNGYYVDDEAHKKATTDALSVACRSLGIGANVYWQGGSKYDTHTAETRQSVEHGQPITFEQMSDIQKLAMDVAQNKDEAKSILQTMLIMMGVSKMDEMKQCQLDSAKMIIKEKAKELRR